MSVLRKISQPVRKILGSAFEQKTQTRKIFDQVCHQDLSVNDVVIDCGANVGLYTTKFAATGAKTYAFEPNPAAFSVLSQNMAGNKNVTLIPKAVADKAGTFPFYMHEHAEEDPVKYSTGSSLLETKNNINPNNHLDVEVVDLATFIRDLDQPVKLLKIDVEGVEVQLLNHLIDTGVAATIEYIFVELHDHKVPDLADGTQKLLARIKAEQLNNITVGYLD